VSHSLKVQQRTEALGFTLGLANEALPSHADDPVTRGEEVCIPLAVALEGAIVLVVTAAVELSNEALFAPEHVYLVAGDTLVDLRGREGVGGDECEERILEDGAGRSGRVLDERAQARCGAATLEVGEKCRKLAKAHATRDLCFVEGSRESAVVEDVCEIDQRARDGRHGDPEVRRYLLWGKRRGPMNGHLRMSAPGPRCDLDGPSAAHGDVPERRRGAMTEHRIGAAGKDRGHRARE
jgi:hypothetical protein